MLNRYNRMKTAIVITLLASFSFLGELSTNGSMVSQATSPFVKNTLILDNNTLADGNVSPPNPQTPWSVAFDSSNGYLYVASGSGLGNGIVTVINPNTSKIEQSIVLPEISSDAYSVLYDPSNEYIYVVSSVGSNNTNVLYAINSVTNKIVSNVTAGRGEARYTDEIISLDPSNGNLYLVNNIDGTVSVISTLTNRVIGTFGIEGTAIAYDFSNLNLYISGSGGIVYVLNGSTNSVTTSIDLGSGNASYVGNPLAYDSINKLLYYSGDNAIWVINGTSNEPISSIPDEYGPCEFGDLAFDNTTGDIYAMCLSNSTLNVIDGANNSVLDYASVGFWAIGISYSPSNGDLYLTDPFVNDQNTNRSVIPDSLVSFNLTTNTVGRILVLGSDPQDIIFDLTNGNAYVLNLGFLYVINGSTNVYTSILNVGYNPTALAVGAPDGYLYVVDSGQVDNYIALVNTTTNTFVNSTRFDGVSALVYDPDNGRLYLGASGEITVMNTNLTTTYGSVQLQYGGTIHDMAIDPLNGNLYVSENESTVTVINTTSDTIVTTVSINPGDNANTGLILSYNAFNQMIYATPHYPESIDAINSTTNTVSKSIQTGFSMCCSAMTVNFLDGDVYGVNGSGYLSVINGSTNVPSSIFSLGTNATLDSLASNTFSGNLYAANSEAGTISVISFQVSNVTSTTSTITTSFSSNTTSLSHQNNIQSLSAIILIVVVVLTISGLVTFFLRRHK